MRMVVFGSTTSRVRNYWPTYPQEKNPIQSIAIAPKENGIIAMSPSGVWEWDFNSGYPETTLRSVFLPVWYEGYARPEHVWQSSSGSDEFEPKLGMWPLVFGTLKA